MTKKIKIHNSTTGYNLISLVYDKKEAYLNSFEKNKVLALLGDVKNKKILDVGAGTGRLAIPLARRGAAVTACDISKEMLARLKNKIKTKIKNLEIVEGDAEVLPFADQTFDIVVAAFLLVHIKDPRRVFDEVYRVLRPGGLFLVTNINQKDPPALETPVGEIKIKSYYHRPERIREMLEALAFSIKKEVFVKESGVWINQIILARS